LPSEKKREKKPLVSVLTKKKTLVSEEEVFSFAFSFKVRSSMA